jgi:hypothetical protein
MVSNVAAPGRLYFAASSSVVKYAAIGNPFPRALATVMTSGVTPQCRVANQWPVRFQAVCTSSAIKRVPCRVQSRRNSAQ